MKTDESLLPVGPLRGSLQFEAGNLGRTPDGALREYFWSTDPKSSRREHGSPATAQHPGKPPLAHAMLPVVAVPQTHHSQKSLAAETKWERVEILRPSGGSIALILGPFPNPHMNLQQKKSLPQGSAVSASDPDSKQKETPHLSRNIRLWPRLSQTCFGILSKSWLSQVLALLSDS